MTYPGQKVQIDVKYVPEACYSGIDGEKFYQYTMIDEADRGTGNDEVSHLMSM